MSTLPDGPTIIADGKVLGTFNGTIEYGEADEYGKTPWVELMISDTAGVQVRTSENQTILYTFYPDKNEIIINGDYIYIIHSISDIQMNLSVDILGTEKIVANKPQFAGYATGGVLESDWNPTVDTRNPADDLFPKVPGIRERVRCPECDWCGTLWTIIIHMNDDHKTSRNDIADWLETLDVDIKFQGENNGN